MATWKKIIVSGSNAHLAQITSSVLTPTNLVLAGTGGALQNSGLTLTGGSLNIGSNSLVSTGAASVLTGSFSGSFVGTTNLPDLTQGAGIVPFIYDGAVPATVAVSGASALNTNAVTKWNGAAFVNSSLTDNGTVISGTTSIQLTGASSILSGSFSGSFQGDGSGLSGIATNLDVSGSDGTGISIDLKTQDLTIGGTANEIETSVAGTTVTIGLPNDVTIGRDLVVSRNLTVLGTASFQSTTDLDVADRFIRLASGSNSAGDGGIAIQQTNSTNAEVFGFDSGATRWGVSSSFDAAQNAFTPDAFMALSLIGAGTNPTAVAARYQVNGNIFIGTDEGIWIYS
jgi:fibronectin-binding autotransporter adhesin